MDFTGLTFSVIYSFTEFIGFIEFTRNFSQNCNQLVVLHDTSGMAALGYTIVLSQSACTATPAPSAELQRNPRKQLHPRRVCPSGCRRDHPVCALGSRKGRGPGGVHLGDCASGQRIRGTLARSKAAAGQSPCPVCCNSAAGLASTLRHQLFESQPRKAKRKLLDFVLSNCRWKQGRLDADYRQPFDCVCGVCGWAAQIGFRWKREFW